MGFTPTNPVCEIRRNTHCLLIKYGVEKSNPLVGACSITANKLEKRMMVCFKILGCILWFPIDVLLLTFHWIKATYWLIAFFIRESLSVTNTTNWPFGCMTEKTKSGQAACIPGKKYANSYLFSYLCPDYKKCGIGCESQCQLKMYELHDRWKPSKRRMAVISSIFAFLWIGIGGSIASIAILHYYPTIPETIAKEYALFFSEREKTSPTVAVKPSLSDKKKAEIFLQSAQEKWQEGKKKEALLEYRNAIRHDPDNEKVYYHLGICLLEFRQRFLDARKAFQRAIRLNPCLWAAHLELAKIEVMLGKYEKALEIAQKVVKNTPEETDIYLVLARCWQQLKNPQEAKKALETFCTFPHRTSSDFFTVASLHTLLGNYALAEKYHALSLQEDTNNLSARVGLAYSYMTNQAWDDATEQLQFVFQEQPDHLEANVAMAELWIRKGNTKKAIKQYKIICKFPDATALHHLKLTSLFFKEKRTDEASHELRFILEKHPDNNEARLLLAKTYLMHKLYTLAIDEANNTLRRNKLEVRAYRVLAEAKVKLGKKNQAINHLEEALRYQPDNIGVLLQLGKLYGMLSQKEKAIDSYLKASEKDAENPLAYTALATFYQQEGELHSAMEYYRKALTISPDNPFLANNLAVLLLNEPDHVEEAYEIMKNLYARYPQHPAILDTYGTTLFQRGNYEESVKIFEKSIAFFPANTPHPLTYYHLGKALLQCEKRDLAEQALSRALQISSSFPGANQAKELLKILQYTSIDP